jgi:hypothetical protein
MYLLISACSNRFNQYYSTELVDRLVQAGALLNIQDNFGRTAGIYRKFLLCKIFFLKNNHVFFVVSITDKLDFFPVLVSNNADVSVQDSSGKTALIYGIFYFLLSLFL